jgi:ribose 5-phosphate isomerase A
MYWNENVVQKLDWNGEISHLEEKQKIAEKIAKIAKDGDVIGVGSGSTSFLAIQAIANRMKNENLKIKAIPTSRELGMVCNYLEIPVETLITAKPDWCFDGADEVTPEKWLVKGRGAAMFREKLNIANAKKSYILVDSSKFVKKPCEKFPIPIEVFPEALYAVKEKLFELGATSAELRLAKKKDGPVITENGNLIVDASFENVDETFEAKLKNIVGVIETGLFIGYNVEIVS